jgi:uncharacterized protein (TIGR03790 family)
MALLLAVPAGLHAALPPADAPEPARVVVVANASARDSRELAEYYATARGIPAENIVALPMPEEETIAWPAFAAKVFNPLFAELAQRGWIESFPVQGTDQFGRRKTMILGHRISYLVVMRGVPLRIDENPDWKSPTPATGQAAAVAVNHAAVDSELSLLVQSGTPVVGFVPNPVYRQRSTTGILADSIVRVARLDGPTPTAVRGLIDSALAGERQGLAGRAYIDIGGPSPLGDKWLDTVARQIAAAGFETDVDRAGSTLVPLARFDAPALYFGWYAGAANGPFTVPGFRFPPGAIAVHIHSYSAQTLRTDKQFWCGPLVAAGAAATLGNVYEPYLEATHNLDLFVEALLRGETFGTAAYYAQPALSWQTVALGDPLYRPFARSQEEQFSGRARLPATLRPYVVLRQARLALQRGDKAGAMRLVRGAFQETPSVALGVSLAQFARETEGPEAAVRELLFLELLPQYDLRDLGAVRTAAALLVECGAGEKALLLYEKALAKPPAVGEAGLLEDAIREALKTGQPSRAAKWQDRLAVVKPPPPPKPAGTK